MMTTRTVNEYMKLPYTVEVFRDYSGDAPGYVARVVELPGCITQADSFAELELMLEDAMRLWIEVTLEDGREVPIPQRAVEYSGEFVVRVPRSLHRRLVEAAAHDGVPVDAFVTMALAQAVGAQQASTAAAHTLYSLPDRQYAQVAERPAATTQGDPP
jgi:antitoxin HicB